MDKPIFLTLSGFTWCATSPLAYTLQRVLKYSHGGYDKSMVYLSCIESQQPDPQWEKYSLHLTDQYENYRYNQLHFMNHTIDYDPIRELPKSHLFSLLSPPFTIDKYITFYKQLYDQVSKKGYKAVADYHLQLTPIFKYSSILKEHFDFKSLLIVRDPIRRAFSHAISKPKELNLKILNNRVFGNLPVVDYIKKYKKLKSLIPDAQMIIMEELWEGDGSEKQKLSSYLNHPVDDLWTNLYSPDVGHHLTWDLDNIVCPNPCQVLCQSDAILTPEYYNELRDKYSYIYDQWIDEFGSLPLHWGQPVDYDANALSPQRHTQSMYPNLYPVTHLQDIYTH